MKQIPLTRGFVALVDDADFDWINQWTWYVNNSSIYTPYAQRSHKVNGVARTTKMHRFILQAAPNVTIDHIDGNGLNNTRANLRICTNMHNLRNARPYANGTSQYKGVHFHAQSGKWRATITVEKRTISLGLHFTEIDAARAYDAAAQHYFGEFARPNFPSESEGAA